MIYDFILWPIDRSFCSLLCSLGFFLCCVTENSCNDERNFHNSVESWSQLREMSIDPAPDRQTFVADLREHLIVPREVFLVPFFAASNDNVCLHARFNTRAMVDGNLFSFHSLFLLLTHFASNLIRNNVNFHVSKFSCFAPSNRCIGNETCFPF